MRFGEYVSAHDWGVAEKDMLFGYNWNEVDHPDECKFGEASVNAGENILIKVTERIKNQLGTRKDLFYTDKIELFSIYDLTDIALKEKGSLKNKKTDDFVRNNIDTPFVKNVVDSKGKLHKTEVHSISSEKLHNKILAWMQKYWQSALVPAKLSTMQYEVAEEVLDQFDKGNTRVFVSLCARFGKTIWSSSLALEADAEIVVIASYVKTVFTSFTNDVMQFKQFVDYVHIDSGAPDYKEKFAEARDAGKKVFFYLSMCQGDYRKERFDFICDQKGSKFLIVDEADYGVHKKNQSSLLLDKEPCFDYIILMTGTNAERAVGAWAGVIQYTTSVVYPELLVQKKEAKKEIQ